MWKRRRKPHPAEPLARATIGIADDARAFLNGTYRLRLQEADVPVPSWAWINQLAHGDLDRVTELARGAPGRPGIEGLVACIANHLLQATKRSHVDLETFQRRKLIPLEEALSRRGDPPPLTEEDFARMLMMVLSDGVSPDASRDKLL